MNTNDVNEWRVVDALQKTLGPCALDKSSLSIGKGLNTAEYHKSGHMQSIFLSFTFLIVLVLSGI